MLIIEIIIIRILYIFYNNCTKCTCDINVKLNIFRKKINIHHFKIILDISIHVKMYSPALKTSHFSRYGFEVI